MHADVDRFRAKVDEAGPASPVLGSPCWLWTGTVDKAGFPRFWLAGNSLTGQRAALLLAGRELDPAQQVINLCGNRQCVRREHLAVCTLAEAHAFHHRGRPRIGPGELAVMRMVVRDDETTVDFVAEAFRLSPEFVRQIAAAG